MGILDNVIRSAVPGGSLAKRLLLDWLLSWPRGR